MKRETMKFLGKAVLFLAIFAMLLAPLQQLLERKSLSGPWDMSNKVGGFYNEPEDEFDLMFFGSSHAYAAFSPLRLWEDTGVKSYVFATQQQPLWATYTYLKEAFKTQRPQAVVVELNMTVIGDEQPKDSVNYSAQDYLPMSWNKVQLAWNSGENLENRTALLFNIFKYHSRWSELKREDFTYDPDTLRDPYKGYVLLTKARVEQARPDITGVTDRTAISEKKMYWLQQIVDLCKEEQVELLFLKSASNLSAEEKAMLNTVEDFAAENEITFHDFNEDYDAIGLNGKMFYDEHHLDGTGAALFTDYFARWLMEQGIDFKTDFDNADWAAAAAQYDAELAKQSA